VSENNPGLLLATKDRSDDLLVADHRHTQATAKTSNPSSILRLIFRIAQHVRNMTNATSSDRARRDRLTGASLRKCAPSRFHPSFRHAMGRGQTDKFAVDKGNATNLRIAQFLSSLTNNFEHRLNSVGELEMTRNTSEVAVCCCSDSDSSRVRRCSASNSRVFSIAITA
jgi:hypothetical protein